MKNYLVLLVTIGICVAYWYQIPEPPSPAPPPPPPPVVKPVVAAAPKLTPAPFVVTHTALDNPTSRVGQGQGNSSVLLGNDTNDPHRN